VRIERRVLATPMVAVFAAIATTDVAFAADSIPAIYAVTDDPFLVFAANAFSVLSMLALYFLLAEIMSLLLPAAHARSDARLRRIEDGARRAVPAADLGLARRHRRRHQRRDHGVVASPGTAANYCPTSDRSGRRQPSTRGGRPMTAALFSRVLVGVDGSPAGFVALDQARRLLAPGGERRRTPWPTRQRRKERMTMRFREQARLGCRGLAVFGAAAMTSRMLLRRPILSWGATDAEAY
jgi:hypothetical protein